MIGLQCEVEVSSKDQDISFINCYTIHLKFSQLAILDIKDKPYSNNYGATSEAILTEFLSLDDITYSPIEDLADFIKEKGKNRFSDSEEIAKLLKEDVSVFVGTLFMRLDAQQKFDAKQSYQSPLILLPQELPIYHRVYHFSSVQLTEQKYTVNEKGENDC